MITLVPKYGKIGDGFSRREQAEAAFHAGRRTDGTQSAASWLMDLVSLRKLISLCGFCARKFNPRRHQYRRWYVPDHTGNTSGYATSGQCDACKSKLIGTGVSFVAEETYSLVCIDPIQARREARMRARAAWTIPRVSRRAREAAARRIA